MVLLVIAVKKGDFAPHHIWVSYYHPKSEKDQPHTTHYLLFTLDEQALTCVSGKYKIPYVPHPPVKYCSQWRMNTSWCVLLRFFYTHAKYTLPFVTWMHTFWVSSWDMRMTYIVIITFAMRMPLTASSNFESRRKRRLKGGSQVRDSLSSKNKRMFRKMGHFSTEFLFCKIFNNHIGITGHSGVGFYELWVTTKCFDQYLGLGKSSSSYRRKSLIFGENIFC